MLQTLFYISPSWFGVPGLVVWLLLCAAWLGVVFLRDRENLKSEFWALLPIIIFGAIGITFLLPGLSVKGVDPENPLAERINRGLAIRGYGVMLMLAVLAGSGVVLYRCRKIGYPADHIFRLAGWMIVCGMIGARLFFIIQYRDGFFEPTATLWETLGRLFDMTRGGLVVYGSMIGALVAAAFVVWKWKLPVWKTADLIAPGMALGLAIGRVGCLLNGCCFGGVCETDLPSVQFPPGSPPYMRQLESGELLGIISEPLPPGSDFSRRVIDPGDGIGKEINLLKGEKFTVGRYDQLRKGIVPFDDDVVRHIANTPFADEVDVRIVGEQIGDVVIPFSRLQNRSRDVHPTQIYSSINALVLCLFLWFYWYVRRNDGEVMALMLILYPISRFVLELIRVDEFGQFGTDLTISQWVSVLTISCGIGLFGWRRMFGEREQNPEAVQSVETGSA